MCATWPAVYHIELPYDAGFETLAGFLLSRLGHIPREAEGIEFDSRTYTVLKMEHNRIARVRIEQVVAPPPLARGPEAGEPEAGEEEDS